MTTATLFRKPVGSDRVPPLTIRERLQLWRWQHTTRNCVECLGGTRHFRRLVMCTRPLVVELECDTCGAADWYC